MDSDGFFELIELIENKTRYQCRDYKERPLRRRIRVRMRAVGIDTFPDYQRYLTDHPGEVEELVKVLTINLSYFFRNEETFAYLQESVFPEFQNQRRLVFWSAGCAQGEEPYTLAIAAAESLLLDRLRIYATDIDDEALTVARRGCYGPVSLEHVPEALMGRYFRIEGKEYCVSEVVKSVVDFRNRDLFRPPDFGPCDLIMCRNVLIYVDRDAQSRILRAFHGSLKTGGYLVLGKVELLLGIPEVQLFELVNRTEHVYRKRCT